MTGEIKVGSRVVVPFGRSELEGTVIRISRLGDEVRVTVELDVSELMIDEPAVTSFRIERVRLASAA